MKFGLATRFAVFSLVLFGRAGAQSLGTVPIFADDFEFGDTGDWSSTTPPRCDEIRPYDRDALPTSWIYVAPPPAGNDSTGDGSPGAPFASIEHAAALADPGTAIRLTPGTHLTDQFVGDLAGSSGAPIWIGGEPGRLPRPVIAGGGEALHLGRAKWVVVHDLEIHGATANGINADDGGETANPLASHHLVFRRVGIHDIGTGGNNDCLKLSGIYDFWVIDSSIARCGGGFSGSGIDCVGCHAGLVARNRFDEMSGNAVQAKGGSADLEMRWNHLVSPGARGFNLGGSTGFAFFRPPLSSSVANAEARDLRAIGNLIVGGDTPFAFVGCVDCLAAHNTIVNPATWLMRILQETTSSGGFTFEPASNGELVNNLFYFEDGDISTHVNIGPNTSPATFGFAHNLWYAWDAPGTSTPSLPSAESGGIYGQNPQLTAAWAIPGSSPAAGAGAVQSWLAGDRLGDCYDSPPSLGAHEAP
jgi:hypothetical protein